MCVTDLSEGLGGIKDLGLVGCGALGDHSAAGLVERHQAAVRVRQPTVTQRNGVHTATNQGIEA